MLQNEFIEKTGIPECYYEQANAMYMADKNSNCNSDFCAKLVRSPKLLIELMRLNAKYSNDLKKQLHDLEYRLDIANQKYKKASDKLSQIFFLITKVD